MLLVWEYRRSHDNICYALNKYGPGELPSEYQAVYKLTENCKTKRSSKKKKKKKKKTQKKKKKKKKIQACQITVDQSGCIYMIKYFTQIVDMVSFYMLTITLTNKKKCTYYV